MRATYFLQGLVDFVVDFIVVDFVDFVIASLYKQSSLASTMGS